MPWPAWKAIALRTWKESGEDNIGLVAAGVAFYAFLALVPLLGAIVLSYGIVAEPATVLRNMKQLTSVMPADTAKLVGEQLMNVVTTSGGKKGFGLLLALGIALFGARNGAGAIVTALNIVYEEKEKRGFVQLNLLALGMTVAAVGVAVLAMIAVAALGYLETLLPALPGWAAVAGKLLSYGLLACVGAAAAAALYRYGPSREKAEWTWLTPGSAFTAVLWLALTIGFGVYVANFGNYDATYGSLGTVVVLLTWLYLSSYILLFGAELNAEVEHQTATDTTSGGDKPVGARGAWAADHVAAEDEATEPALAAPARETRRPSAPANADERSPGYGSLLGMGQATRVAGLGKVGLVTTALAAAGLGRLRTRDQTGVGVALLAAAGGLALLRRSKA